MNSVQSPIEREAEQDVVVVGRERRDDVRFVAELDERDEIVVLAVHPLPDERLGGGDGREERRLVRRLRVRAARPGTRAIMLDEASIISAMRRPGNDTSCVRQRRVRIGEREHEERQAGEEQQQRAVADERRATIAPLQSSTRRQRHLRASRPCCRVSARHDAARPPPARSATTIAMIASSRCVNSRSATRTLRHSKITSPDDRRDLGYRDHARLSSAVPRAPRREPLHEPGLLELQPAQHLPGRSPSASSSAPSSSLPSRPNVRGRERGERRSQRFEQRGAGRRLRRRARARRAIGLRRDRAGDRDRACRAASRPSGSGGPAPRSSLPSAEQRGSPASG